jgi:hypothetical protein
MVCPDAMKISLALGATDAEADGAAELDGAGVAAGVVAEVVLAGADPADAALGAAAGDDGGDVADDAAGLVLAELQAVISSAARPSPDPAMTRMTFMIPLQMDARRTVLVRSR